ncbi:MAG: hypothetical protein RL329_1120 [Bacteroidota bacterium]
MIRLMKRIFFKSDAKLYFFTYYKLNCKKCFAVRQFIFPKMLEFWLSIQNQNSSRRCDKLQLAAPFSTHLSYFHPKYFPTIGIRRPIPNALLDTRNTGAVCSRLNSLKFTILRTLVTNPASKPAAIKAFGLCRFSIY